MMEMEQDDGPGGALVEEAKRIMQDDAEENQRDAPENTGPKIKMGKLGRKKTKDATAPTKTSAAPGAKVETQ